MNRYEIVKIVVNPITKNCFGEYEITYDFYYNVYDEFGNMDNCCEFISGAETMTTYAQWMAKHSI